MVTELRARKQYRHTGTSTKLSLRAVNMLDMVTVIGAGRSGNHGYMLGKSKVFCSSSKRPYRL